MSKGDAVRQTLESRTLEGRLAEKDRTRADQAALLGTGLAAVVAVSFGPGSWGWWSVGVGATLLLVIFAFYRVPDKDTNVWTRVREILALAAVAGYCSTILLGYPLQTWWKRQGGDSFCNNVANAAAVKVYKEVSDIKPPNYYFADEAAKESATYNASEDAYNHAYDDCIGYYGSENLAYIGFAAALMFFIGALIRSRFKNPPPGTTV